MLNIIPVQDIKFALIFTYFIFLYFRKRRRAFINIGLCGYVSLFLSLLLQLDKGIKAIVLIFGLVVGFMLSYKELELLEKNDVDAKEFLNLDVVDIVVLIVFLIAWVVIKNLY